MNKSYLLIVVLLAAGGAGVQGQSAVKERSGSSNEAITSRTIRYRSIRHGSATNNDRNLVIATYILAVIAALQLLVFSYQAYQLRETVKAATEQSKAMERSINESVRSASAMERVATHIEISAKAATDSAAALRERTAQQMRAYLTVVVGEGFYQDRKADIKFEAKPLLVNTGQTPAHKVKYRAKAAVLPFLLPPNFKLPPLPEKPLGSSVVGPHQNASLSAIVDNYLPDQDVDAVKHIKGNLGLYVWGVVEYEDIFGQPHQTKFGQQIHWRFDNSIFGLYMPGFNDAN